MVREQSLASDYFVASKNVARVVLVDAHRAARRGDFAAAMKHLDFAASLVRSAQTALRIELSAKAEG